jgi:photosystem II stability/assembly factor-like uncharacterized protein
MSDAALTTPDVTLVYFGPGVAVVGVSSSCCGNQGTTPSKLYLSTDLVHWRNVTPTGSQRSREPGQHPFFESASFLDADTGWVTTWDAANDDVRIWKTTNRGRTWTGMTGHGHSANAGATTTVQLVSPNTAFMEWLEPTGPGMGLSLTHDAGAHWRTVYAGSTPGNERQPPNGPFEMPLMFLNDSIGFGAEGIPPANPLTTVAPGYVFRTSDGGDRWSPVRPPGAASPPCPPAHTRPAAFTCFTGLPAPVGGQNLVLPVVLQRAGQAVITFDTSHNDGVSWSKARTLVLPIAAPSSADQALGQLRSPLVSIASPTAWWATFNKGRRLTALTSTDAGQHWRRATAVITGTPLRLWATTNHQAWLLAEVPSSGGSGGETRQLLVTNDAGDTWHRWR